MKLDLITIEDLEIFKEDLLTEIKEMLKGSPQSDTSSEWLRSAQVRDLLNISQGTLQNLRINRTLSYSMVGKTVYYKRKDIVNLLETNFKNL